MFSGLGIDELKEAFFNFVEESERAARERSADEENYFGSAVEENPEPEEGV